MPFRFLFLAFACVAIAILGGLSVEAVVVLATAATAAAVLATAATAAAVLATAATHGPGSACRSTPVAHRAMAQVGHLFIFLAGPTNTL
jgi:hypothetical protein